MSEILPAAFAASVFTAFDNVWQKRTPVDFPNAERDFDPDQLPNDATAAWARVFLLGDVDGEDKLAGNVNPRLYRERGRITIEIYTRVGFDTDRAYELAEIALSFLRANAVAETVFSDVSAPQEFGDDGTWYQVAVGAAWVYWTDRAA